MKDETLSPLSTEEEKENRRKLVCALAELICVVQQPTFEVKDLIHKGAAVILLIQQRWPDIEAEPLEPPFNILETLAWASGSLIEEVLSLRKPKEARKTGSFVQDLIACFAMRFGRATDLSHEIERVLIEEKFKQVFPTLYEELLAEFRKKADSKEGK